MARNNEDSNPYPDWYNSSLNDHFPSDLEHIEPYNPSLQNHQLDQIGGTSFAGVEQLWANDSYVGSTHQGNHMAMNDEVVYPRTASNSPGIRQYTDLQITDLGEQFGSSSLQVDTAPNNGSYNGSIQRHSLFMTDRLTTFPPNGSFEFYANEPCSNLTAEYGPSTHEYPDYLLQDLSLPAMNVVPEEECGLSYRDFGTQPGHDVAGETSSNGQPESEPSCSGVDMPSSFAFMSEAVNTSALREVGPNCSSLSMPSGNEFMGDPRNSGALGGIETSFTLLGVWQPSQDRSNNTLGSSSGAVPRRTQSSRSAVSTTGGSSSFPQGCGGETSDSRSYSNCQDNLASTHHNLRQKRYRTPKCKYDAMTPEEKMLHKRKLGAEASKRYWEGKRTSETQTRHIFDTESARNLDLQETLTRDQLRVQLMSTALQNLNIDPNSRHADEEEKEDDDDSFKEM